MACIKRVNTLVAGAFMPRLGAKQVNQIVEWLLGDDADREEHVPVECRPEAEASGYKHSCIKLNGV